MDIGPAHAPPAEPLTPPAPAGPHVLVAAAAAVATIAVELATYFLARGGDRELYALLASLGVGLIWTAVAAPVLAAGAQGVFWPLLRGGVVADASAVSLLVLAAVSPLLSTVAAVEIYLVYLASSLLGVAAVCCARRPAARAAAAAVIAILQAALLAGPFWTGGILAEMTFPANSRLANAVMASNPFGSITAALFARTDYVWNTSRIMYSLKIQSYVSASPRWHHGPLLLGAAAAVLAACAIVAGRVRLRRRRLSETPPGPA